LHARAAAKFVEMAQGFDAEIHVSRDGETVNADSIMELLMLAASKGSEIGIETSGPEAEQAVASLAELVEAGFYETE
ncbi:MAG: HPr family phosphocarrier protein, partial [Alphaproteobacteria bacterium]|nr:HPr family phosphocarrier protein [Alphaproteobacteria bacterium]